MKKHTNLAAYPWLLALLLPACSTVEVQEPQNALAALEPGEAVTVVLNSYFGSDETYSAEDSISKCVTKAVHKANPLVKVIPPDEFRRVAFPDLELNEMPHSVESFKLLLDNPSFLDRIAPMGLRYLVIAGSTNNEVSRRECLPPFLCGHGWYKSSRLAGIILDVKQARTLPAELSATASGKSWFYLIVILPLGFRADPGSAACDGFGKAVAKAIVSGGAKP